MKLLIFLFILLTLSHANNQTEIKSDIKYNQFKYLYTDFQNGLADITILGECDEQKTTETMYVIETGFNATHYMKKGYKEKNCKGKPFFTSYVPIENELFSMKYSNTLPIHIGQMKFGKDKKCKQYKSKMYLVSGDCIQIGNQSLQFSIDGKLMKLKKYSDTKCKQFETDTKKKFECNSCVDIGDSLYLHHICSPHEDMIQSNKQNKENKNDILIEL